MSTAPQNAPQDIDEEIVDIFVEEATEVLETLATDVPAWKEDSSNRTLLTDIRRAFHTLKGSGRMAKALQVAEVAWQVEQALNRALDGSLSVSPSLIEMVAKARAAIVPMIQALGERQACPLSERELAQLLAYIQAIAKGEEIPVLQSASPAAPVITPAPVDLGPLQSELAECMRRIDEMAGHLEKGAARIQHLSAQLEGTAGRQQRLEESLPEDLPSRQDVDSLQTQLQSVSGGVSDVKHLVKATIDRVAQQQLDVQDALNRRVSEESVALAKRNNELQEQMDALRSQQADARRWMMIGFGGLAALLAAVASLVLLP
ncbi:hypothetical protein HDN1F_05800 [gamma proteobacterium HdN1]|nr:hypothetical protein HDN1F_05800 [gamma proteobacterium HdN1]